MITSELPIEVASVDEAFASAITPKRFKDIVLEPYSLLRQMVAEEVCGENSHPVTSVIVHMWVCTLGPREVLNARSDRKAAFLHAFEWAQAHGVEHPGSPAMDHLIELYRQINQEIRASTKLEPEEGNGQEPKNAGGLRG